MAATTTCTKIAVNLVLDNGSGKTVSISLGSLNKTAFDADKVMAIVSLLTPCLDKSLVRTEKVEVSTLTAGA
jgi:hypothetical protein